jgi:hypothetical protein
MEPLPPPPDDAISRLRPWEPEPRLQLRRRLNDASLRANARARRATSPDAERLFRDIARIAGEWSVEWRCDGQLDEALADILDALTRMHMAAGALERTGSGL